MSGVIEARKLGKRYRRYSVDRPFTLQEAIIKRMRGLRPIEYHWALRDVSFVIKKGSMVGVVGHNGAGKSTLLRLLGGVGRPDEGSLSVHGVVGGLLDIGAGFHPDLSGRENVYVNGIVSGLLRSEVEERFNDMVDFAELGKVIDEPLRTYSMGMKMRLGFAVAAYTDPDILLIDEVLAVGDIAFRQKCIDRIGLFRKRGKTIIYVTHDIEQIEALCDEALMLHNGSMVRYGTPADVMPVYIRQMHAGS